jgi:hypothetical protein
MTAQSNLPKKYLLPFHFLPTVNFLHAMIYENFPEEKNLNSIMINSTFHCNERAAIVLNCHYNLV